MKRSGKFHASATEQTRNAIEEFYKTKDLLTFAKPSTEEKINLLRAHKYALIGQKKELLRKIRNIDKEIKEILTEGGGK